jgi:hypothetical protein
MAMVKMEMTDLTAQLLDALHVSTRMDLKSAFKQRLTLQDIRPVMFQILRKCDLLEDPKIAKYLSFSPEAGSRHEKKVLQKVAKTAVLRLLSMIKTLAAYNESRGLTGPIHIFSLQRMNATMMMEVCLEHLTLYW